MLTKSKKIIYKLLNNSSSNKNFADICYKFDNSTNFISSEYPNIFDKRMEEGFIYIYKTFLFALKENDVNYFNENCELKFSKKIKDSLAQNKEAKNLSINIHLPEDKNKSVEIKTITPEFSMGITLDRDYNKRMDVKENVLTDDFLGKLSAMLHKFQGDKAIKIYNLPLEENEPKMIIRMHIDFKSEVILSLDKNAKNKDFEIHNMVLETETSNRKHLLSILERSSFSMLNKLLGVPEDAKLDWKISDFDLFLNKNPLI